MSFAGRPSGKFTQHRRIDRLREVLTRHPSGLTLVELAEQLNVSTRTMGRYLREVEREFDLELVNSKKTAAPRWKIRSGELPRKVELRRTQVYALLAARRVFEPLRGSAIHDEIGMAVEKLTTFAQRPGRGPNAGVADARLEQRFLYLPFAPKDYSTKSEELDDLFQAVSDLRPLSLEYQSIGKSTGEKITIHPYAMVLHRDSIYCVGYHCQRQQIRTFLLDRMQNTETDPIERFELPVKFKVDDYFQGEFGIWKSELKQKVVLEFDAKAAEYVRLRRVHPSQKLSLLNGGRLRMTLNIGNFTQLTSWLLEWGPRVKVLEPPELVERIRTELKLAWELYEADLPPEPKKTKAASKSEQAETGPSKSSTTKSRAKKS